MDSLICQTFSQFEVLCIDDESEDASVEVIRQYQAKDSRIKLLQQPHQGVSAARNLGISHARGRYLAFVDGDDWVEPEMLQKMFLTAEAQDCDMVVCSAEVHFEQKSRHTRKNRSLQTLLTVKDGQWVDSSAEDIWRFAKLPGNWPFVWNKLIRKRIITENNIRFPQNVSLGEDGVFLYLVFNYLHKAVFLSEPLYHYRYQRKESATVKLAQNRNTRFSQHLIVASALLDAFAQRELICKNSRALLLWCLNFLYSDFIHLPAKNRADASIALRDLFSMHDLLIYSADLPAVEKRRLKNMLNTEYPCSESKRIFDILWTKIENRIILMLCKS